MISTTVRQCFVFCSFALILVSILGQSVSSSEAHATMKVNGRHLPYTVSGEGETVVLIHGAVSDRRTWSRQQAILATEGYRVVAFTQRYYGKEHWDAKWPPYRIRTHADDVAAFVRGLGSDKVHLVAWSSGGHIALTVALESPELVKSVLVYEPVVPSYVVDKKILQAIDSDAKSMVGPVFGPMTAGNLTLAAQLFLNGVAQQPGYFDTLSNSARQIVLDNARVLPLMFDGGETDVSITCAQMRRIIPPVMISRGEYSRPFFSLIANTAMRCVGGGHHMVVSGANHMWPGDHPDEFVKAVVGYIRKN